MTEPESNKRFSILVGLDDSPCSWKAFDEALIQARLKQAYLHIVSVQERVESSYSASEVLAAEKTAHEKLEIAQVKARQKAEKMGLGVRTTIIPDASTGALVKYARENHIDLVVIGDKGHLGLLESLLGNTADRLVRQVPCSILIVR